MDKIKSSLYNLKRIVEDEMQFNIPRYQRLYVWEDEQVETLFHDLHTACSTGRDMYYLGGVILVRNKKKDGLFDLVDGQQRFTTLWLIANELGDLLKSFRNKGEDLRIKFAIRKEVEGYFKCLSTYQELTTELSKEFEDLVRIDLARRRLKELISAEISSEGEKRKFAEFITENLKLVVTIVPEQTDLNKLFETLNNRGEQLSQDEILKARILSGIKNRNTRWEYSCVWNACKDTRNYLERALSFEVDFAKEVAKCYYEWKNNTFDYNRVKSLFARNNNQTKSKSLSSLLTKRNIEEIIEKKPEDILKDLHPHTTDDELQNVRSILTFPQLLLHTLRIYRCKRGLTDIQRINEKELLKIFDEYFLSKKTTTLSEEINDFEKNCIDFIDLLFSVREVFDKYIVKWVEIDKNNEELMIKKVRKQNQKRYGQTYYLRREISDQIDGLTHLQGILYHSQQNTTQYWLTPYLYWLLKHPNFEDAYDWLKKLDNILFCTNRDDELLTDRTWECMEGCPEYEIDYSILNEELGTRFPHYWFYKIDFILWYERDKLGKPKWSEYKVTAKNSIEHIGPKNPEDKRNKVCHDFLDRMGNLVLVTRSINSEYGDQPYGVKQARFKDKRNKGSYDSLKSDLIYDNADWNDDLAEKHQKRIIEIVEAYFEETKIQ